MGIGIIALGLWLLLGISFSINSIELFPDALSMMIIMAGIVIVFRRVKSRELLISLGLWIISFITVSYTHLDVYKRQVNQQ